MSTISTRLPAVPPLKQRVTTDQRPREMFLMAVAVISTMFRCRLVQRDPNARLAESHS
jgi:hypothetical protein